MVVSAMERVYVKRSTGHTHTHTTAGHTTHTNTERATRRTREEQGWLCQLWSVLTSKDQQVTRTRTRRQDTPLTRTRSEQRAEHVKNRNGCVSYEQALVSL